MPTLNPSSANIQDNTVTGATFALVRNAGAGTSVFNRISSGNLLITSQAVMIIKDPGRGGGTFRVRRYFLGFDTSGITSTVSSAAIKFTTATNNDLPRVAVVKTTSNGSSTGNFEDIDGFVPGDNTTMAGNVTDYSSQPAADFSSAGLGTTFTLTLNSTALSDIQSLNTFFVGLISYNHDYLNVEPSGTGQSFFDVGHAQNGIILDYTLAGYGNDVIGVASADIGEVNGVATADIAEINGL